MLFRMGFVILLAVLMWTQDTSAQPWERITLPSTFLGEWAPVAVNPGIPGEIAVWGYVRCDTIHGPIGSYQRYLKKYCTCSISTDHGKTWSVVDTMIHMQKGPPWGSAEMRSLQYYGGFLTRRTFVDEGLQSYDIFQVRTDSERFIEVPDAYTGFNCVEEWKRTLAHVFTRDQVFVLWYHSDGPRPPNWRQFNISRMSYTRREWELVTDTVTSTELCPGSSFRSPNQYAGLSRQSLIIRQDDPAIQYYSASCGLYRSLDSGRTRARLPVQPSSYTGEATRQVFLHPKDVNTLIYREWFRDSTTSLKPVLARSSDGGTTWRIVENTDQNDWVADWNKWGTMVRLRDNRVELSLDTGWTWTNISGKLKYARDPVVQTQGDTLTVYIYAGDSYEGGLQRWTNVLSEWARYPAIIAGGLGLEVFPSPVASNSSLQVEATSEPGSEITLTVVDMLGREVATHATLHADVFGTARGSVDVAQLGLPTGMYMVHAFTTTRQGVRRFIVTR